MLLTLFFFPFEVAELNMSTVNNKILILQLLLHFLFVCKILDCLESFLLCKWMIIFLYFVRRIKILYVVIYWPFAPLHLQSCSTTRTFISGAGIKDACRYTYSPRHFVYQALSSWDFEANLFLSSSSIHIYQPIWVWLILYVSI